MAAYKAHGMDVLAEVSPTQYVRMEIDLDESSSIRYGMLTSLGPPTTSSPVSLNPLALYHIASE
ncbi:hypothetical protein HN911_03560 [Candidatus Bathyarchaeota archaeon]|nr:hypothetical protein [Candidatus Bathyarchaeota archaeon]